MAARKFRQQPAALLEEGRAQARLNQQRERRRPELPREARVRWHRTAQNVAIIGAGAGGAAIALPLLTKLTHQVGTVVHHDPPPIDDRLKTTEEGTYVKDANGNIALVPSADFLDALAGLGVDPNDAGKAFPTIGNEKTDSDVATENVIDSLTSPWLILAILLGIGVIVYVRNA